MVYQLKNAGVLRDMLIIDPDLMGDVLEDAFMDCGVLDVYEFGEKISDCTKMTTDRGMTLCMVQGATKASHELDELSRDDPSKFTPRMEKVLSRIDKQVDYIADMWYEHRFRLPL